MIIRFCGSKLGVKTSHACSLAMRASRDHAETSDAIDNVAPLPH
jgi:hypothetical protein